MKALAFVLIAMVAMPAAACDRALFGGWSHHVDNGYDYNSSHDLIGIQCHGVSVIRFNNSYHQESYGLGYELMPYTWGRFEFGAYAALWTGYDEAALLPVGGVRVRYNIGRLGIVATTAYEVSTLHLEWRF